MNYVFYFRVNHNCRVNVSISESTVSFLALQTLWGHAIPGIRFKAGGLKATRSDPTTGHGFSLNRSDLK